MLAASGSTSLYEKQRPLSFSPPPQSPTSSLPPQLRSPEMAPRLVYRNKKYGRKSIPIGGVSTTSGARSFNSATTAGHNVSNAPSTSSSNSNGNDGDRDNSESNGANNICNNVQTMPPSPREGGEDAGGGGGGTVPINAASSAGCDEQAYCGSGQGDQPQHSLIYGERTSGDQLAEDTSDGGPASSRNRGGNDCDIFSSSPPPSSCHMTGSKHGHMDLDLTGQDARRELVSRSNSNNNSSIYWSREYSSPYHHIDSYQSNGMSLGQTSSLGSESSKLSEYTLFTPLDPLSTGHVQSSSVEEYWDLIGISPSNQILPELGYGNLDSDRQLDLRHLTHLLEEEINQSQEFIRFPTVRAAVLTYVHEVKILKAFLDNLTKERDKLKLDIQEANQRVGLLAQEVDEQNARQEQEAKQRIQQLEQRWIDQLKDVTSRLESEKEQSNKEVQSLTGSLKELTTRAKEEKDALMAEIEKLKVEISRLEDENSSLLKRVEEHEVVNSERSKAGFLGMDNGCEDFLETGAGQQRISQLEKEVERLSSLNKDLQDKSDELESILNIERRERDRASSKNVQIIPIGESDKERRLLEQCIAKVKIKCDLEPQTDLSDKNVTKKIITDIFSKQSKGRILTGPKSLPATLQAPSVGQGSNKRSPNQANGPNVQHLEQHCRNLEGELDQVKVEIVRMMSEREGYSRENETLRQYKLAFLQLSEENDELRRQLEQVSCQTAAQQLRLGDSCPEKGHDSFSSVEEDLHEIETEVGSHQPVEPAQAGQLLSVMPDLGNADSCKDEVINSDCKTSDLVMIGEPLAAGASDGKSDDASADNKTVMDKAKEKEVLQGPMVEGCRTSEDRSSPDGQEFDLCLLQNGQQHSPHTRADRDQDEKDKDTKIELLEKQCEANEARHAEAVAELEAKIAELEESLQLMQKEFEAMEDYWQKKLEEERNFYEEQIRQSEDQFRELELRMKEYELLLIDPPGSSSSNGFSTPEIDSTPRRQKAARHDLDEVDDDILGGGKDDPLDLGLDDAKQHSSNQNLWPRDRRPFLTAGSCRDLLEDDKLSTIEESCSMEQQVTEWEEEIQELRCELEEKESKHREDLEALESSWRQRLEELQSNHSKEMEKAEQRLMMGRPESKAETVVARLDHNVWALDEASDKQLGAKSHHQLSGAKSSTFIPHIPSLSPRQGPSSLPIELVNTAQREVRRLQELRRIIQEECDSLLLRKERLREEVGQIQQLHDPFSYSLNWGEGPPHPILSLQGGEFSPAWWSVEPAEAALPAPQPNRGGGDGGKSDPAAQEHPSTGLACGCRCHDESDCKLVNDSVASQGKVEANGPFAPFGVTMAAKNEQDSKGTENELSKHASNVRHPCLQCSQPFIADFQPAAGLDKSGDLSTADAGKRCCGGPQTNCGPSRSLLLCETDVVPTCGMHRSDVPEAAEAASQPRFQARRDAQTQAPCECCPCCAGIVTTATELTEAAQAFKVMYLDIVREKGLAEHEVKRLQTTSVDHNNQSQHIVVKNVKERLDLQTERCKQLASALRSQQQQAATVLASTREQHAAEIRQLEGLVTAAQQLVSRQTMRYSQQAEKLCLADRVISQLISENDTLLTALLSLQEQTPSLETKESEESRPTATEERKSGPLFLESEEI